MTDAGGVGSMSDREIEILRAELERLKGVEAELRKSNEAYKRLERKFLTLTENSPDIIARFDRDMRCLYVNQAIVPITGRLPEFYVNQRDSTFGLPEDVYREFAEGCREVFATGREVVIELKYTGLPGPRIYQAYLAPEITSEGEIETLLCAARDITGQKAADQLLGRQARELEARIKELNCLFEISKLVERQDISLDDICRGIVEILPPAWRYPENLVVRITFEDRVFTSEGFKESEYRLSEAIYIEGRKIGEIEVFYLEPRSPEINGPFIGEEQVLLNEVARRLGRIYERVESRQLLQESEERYRAVFEQAGDSIVLIIPETGEFLEFNDRAHQTLGYTREEFKQLTLRDVTVEDRIPTDMETGVDVYETRHQAKDGRILDVTSGSRIINVGGRDLVLAIWRDLTESKKSERVKAHLEGQLRQSQKMEAIGTLAGGIAHDFNNLLWAITGYAEMSLEEAAIGDPIYENLTQLLKAASRAKDLVQQILVFSRHSGTEKDLLSLGALIEEAYKFLRATLPSTIEIVQELDEPAVFIEGNETQIHQVLMNLCSNASHAMQHQGGVLTIGLAVVDVDEAMAEQYPDLIPGPYAELRVIDTGHGMEPSLMARIFEPFFTTKNPVEGTGMGLAAVHGIVKSHGGAILVDSQPGYGSRFFVYFPIVEGRPPDLEDSLEQIPKGKEHILFVDDEELLVEMTTQLLSHLGYQVTSYCDSREALIAFENNPDEYDLIITDQTMPHMTGIELTRRVKKLAPKTPIILCTGYSETVTEEVAKSQGVSAFILKPLIARQLAELIREVVEREK